MNYSYNLFLNPREIEMKFLLASGVRQTLEASGPFLAVTHKTLHELTTYYDTPDEVLNNAGLSLRVRQIDGGARVQTVKSRVIGLDLAEDRHEWEWPADQDQPDVSKLRGIPALAAFAEQTKGRLQPVFTCDIQRTVRLLSLDGNSSVEAAIDVGSIASEGRSEPVSELELELKSGDVQSMYTLARTLVGLAPVCLASESKAARGWKLRTGQTERIREAIVPVFCRSVRASEGFHQIVGSILGHLIANIGPTLRGDPEGLHQMRRALRNSRAALKLFDRYLSGPAAAAFDAKLRRYGQIFGIARDWDVFRFQTLPAAMANLPGEGLRNLYDVADVQRKIAHSQIVDVIESAKFTKLILDLAIWVETGGKQPSKFGDARMDKTLLSLSPKMLTRAVRKVKRRARKPGSLSDRELHSLRKAFDQLGSDLKFLSSLYPKKSVTAYRNECKTIKAVLGSNNDAIVTRDLIAKLSTKHCPEHAKSAGALSLWSHKQHCKALIGLKTTLSNFRKTPGFWT